MPRGAASKSCIRVQFLRKSSNKKREKSKSEKISVKLNVKRVYFVSRATLKKVGRIFSWSLIARPPDLAS
jgi:hypothetical protein